MFSEFLSPASGVKLDALSILLADRIPSWPISGDKPGPSLRRLPAHEAMHKPYFQFNHAARTGTIIVDCDHAELFTYRQSRLPMPNYLVYNQKTLRHHIGWILKTPVYHGVKSSPKPKRLLDHVRRILTAGASGDPFYTNQIGRNPLAPGDDCKTVLLNSEPYDLAELFAEISDNVPDDIIASANPFIPRIHSEDEDSSRNCSLFNATRRIAYQIRPDHKDPKTFESAVAALAMASNTFEIPLPLSEVKSIARSIAKWAWRKIPATYRPSRFKPDQYSTPETPFSFAHRPANYAETPTHRRRPIMTSRCWKLRFDTAVLKLIPLIRQPYVTHPRQRRIANRFCAFTIEQLAALIGLCRAAAHPKIKEARKWLADHEENAELRYREANPDISSHSDFRPRLNSRKPYPRRPRRRQLPNFQPQMPRRDFADIIKTTYPQSWVSHAIVKWTPIYKSECDPDSWFTSGRFDGDINTYRRVTAWQSKQPKDYWTSIGWDDRPPWEKGCQDENGAWRIARSLPDDMAA